MTPSRGFTLVETMVAVTLLATTIVLPYYAIQRSLIATYSSRDDLIASALAQEAIEYVRGVRDSNYLFNEDPGNIDRSWLYGVDGSSSSPNCRTRHCTLDATKTTPITTCAQLPGGQTGCTQKLYVSSTNLYNQALSGTQTPFIRYFQISCVDGSSCNLASANEVVVTATVTWTSHGTQSIVVTDVLSNWI